MEDSEKNKLLAQNEIQEIQRQANGWNFNKPVNPYRKFFQEVVGIKKPLHPPEIVQGYAQSIKALKEFQLCTRQIHNAIEPEVQRILPAVNEILKNYKELTDEIRIFERSLQSIVNSIDWRLIMVPGLSEEEKQKRIDAFRQWGAYGWTMIPHASFKYFNAKPMSKKEANRKALACFRTKKQMEEFWQAFEKKEKLKKSDFDEAVVDFNNRRYKSCAMILYSLIDARTIRLQGKPKDNPLTDAKNKRKRFRKSGSAASNMIKKKYDQIHEKDMHAMFFSYLAREGLFYALDVFYKGGDDFKEQPDIMNRNFVDHGMLHRKVRRIDCIQLFLVYYNFLTFEEQLTARDRKELKKIE